MKRKRTNRSSRALGCLGVVLIILALGSLFLISAGWLGRILPKAQDVTEVVESSSSLESASGDDELSRTTQDSSCVSGEPSAQESQALSHEESVGVDTGYQLVVFRGDYAQFIGDLSAALRARNPHICLENYTGISHSDVYACEYGGFWVKGWTSYLRTLYAQDGSEITFLHVDFEYDDMAEDELARMCDELDAATDETLSRIAGQTDVWSAAKAVHDELCASITYDHEKASPHIRDLYGALVLHKAICSGYSSAFMYLMGRLGFETCGLTSETHAWNALRSVGADRFVDVAWDDYDISDAYGRPYIAYDYFFLTTEELYAAGEHVPAEPVPDLGGETASWGLNYHVHEGFYLTTFDTTAMEDMLRAQYESGSNTLTLRFADDASFECALAWLQDSFTGVGQTLSAIGYTQPYVCFYDDLVRTVTIGLYAEG